MDINIDRTTTGQIRDIADKEQREHINIIRRALGLYFWVHSVLWGSGNKIAVVDSNGKILRQLRMS